MKILLQILCVVLVIGGSTVAFADEKPSAHQHGSGEATCHLPLPAEKSQATGSTTNETVAFEGLQIETSDITLYESFFGNILQAPMIQTMDHPQMDSIRGYCFRGVLVVIRQDLRTPRPTGWVQINFSVQDVAAVQEALEQAYRGSVVYQLGEEERAKIVRFRLKPDVRRGERKATRLEVYGPEGFMIGFDQYK